ncbi:MAG TPA: glycosyltransferase, partial [Acidimicrobiia bacterium]|nr:glycosyltransferase [Acidimicrobiia bacterium]
MDTMEPGSISSSIADETGAAALDPDPLDPVLIDPEADDDEPGQRLPPVVVVVVTKDPGPWLEATLRSLAAQDYPQLAVLVLDNGSADDPTARIAQALPTAFVRRRDADDGFAAAANDALAAVEGATFLLFCHDDVTLDAGAVSVMVEEAYRSNAGIVGPKVVDSEHPEILLEVGMTIDHYAVPFSGIEPDEVDQEQHDAVRDVFFVSHTVMLVRDDLFRELDGFDAATDPGADDVDLCWRARLAGARVVVAPGARVLHQRAPVVEARAPRAKPAVEVRAETTARIRVLCKSYSSLALIWVLPTAFVLGLAEAAGLVLSGRFAAARAVVAGWLAAFRHPGELRRARKATQRLRRVEDGDVRDLMIRGSARVRTYFTQRVHAGDRLAEVSNRTRERMTETGVRMRRAPAIIAAILGVVVFFSVRSLLFGSVPQVGSFLAWPAVGDTWSTFTGSWRTTLMGAPDAATPAFGLMTIINGLLLGHEGWARSLIVGGALPLGAFGAYRLTRPFAQSALPGVAAAVAYAANPIARNAIFGGELGPLVLFALAPFVFHAFVRAVDAENPTTRSRAHVLGTITILSAVAGAVWPPAIAVGLAFAIAFLVTAPFAGTTPGALRGAAYGALATVAAAILLAPWSFTLVGADAATWGAQPRPALSLGEVLHFHTGSMGAGFASWGIVFAAVVPLLIATGPRFVWAARAWVLAVLSYACVWLPGRIDAGAPALAPDGLLVLAGIALAFAAGLGVAAVLDDLRRFHFGWRQVTTIVGVAGLTVAFFGLAADSLSGRFGLDGQDWPTTYAWMGDTPAVGGFRTLWVGDPVILPLDPKTAGAVGFATTRDGSGDVRALWAAPESDADRTLASALDAAQSGATARLGHLL